MSVTIAYVARHAIDPPPDPRIPNEAQELLPRGIKYALKVMGPKLRKDIEKEILGSHGHDYTIEVFFGPTKRMAQTKDEILKSFDGLKNVRIIEEPRLRARDFGKSYGLSKEEVRKLWPDGRQFSNMAHDMLPQKRIFIKPPGNTSETEFDVMKRTREVLLEQLAMSQQPKADTPALVFKVFVTSGLACQELRRGLAPHSKNASLRNIEGSIYKLRGSLHTQDMIDEGFLASGQRAKATNIGRGTA